MNFFHFFGGALPIKIGTQWAVVVAQLVEWLFSMPDVLSSKTVIGKILFIFSLSIVSKRQKLKKREAGNGHLKKCVEMMMGVI